MLYGLKDQITHARLHQDSFKKLIIQDFFHTRKIDEAYEMKNAKGN